MIHISRWRRQRICRHARLRLRTTQSGACPGLRQPWSLGCYLWPSPGQVPLNSIGPVCSIQDDEFFLGNSMLPTVNLAFAAASLAALLAYLAFFVTRALRWAGWVGGVWGVCGWVGGWWVVGGGSRLGAPAPV